MNSSFKNLFLTLLWVFVLAVFFAQVEIQIEGANGWGGSLPTWRIKNHWLLDLFWGGRAMTGYHAWVFPFIAIFFHFPIIWMSQWNWKIQARIAACIIIFWITEDCLWFVMNPAYGISSFNPVLVPWHRHWLWGTPIDYWIGGVVAILLLCYSYRSNEKRIKNLPTVDAST